MDKFKENTDTHHYFAPEDVNGLPVTPSALRYRVMGFNSEEGPGALVTELLPWTTLATSVREIVVPAAMNIIGTTGASRHVCIEVTHNGGEKITHEIVYLIENLKGIQSAG